MWMGDEIHVEGNEPIILGEYIGLGGFSVVYETTINERTYACKVVPLSFLNEDEYRVFTRERYLSEKLKAMEKNDEQPYPTGLPKYLEVGTGTVDFEGKDDVEVLYFIMEKGKNDLRGARLTKQEYQECVKTLIEALIVLHKQHVMHRDIKPNNIMMRDDGSFMFVDFGFAKEIGDSNNSVLGTKEYEHPAL